MSLHDFGGQINSKMGWNNVWQKKREGMIVIRNFFNSAAFVQPFYLLSVTLLSLLFPLSYLLLARLSTANYFLSLINGLPTQSGISSSSSSPSFIFSCFLYTNPTLLHGLVAIITLSTLAHTLTGRITILNELPGQSFRPKLHLSWIFLSVLQVCVGLGIEASIEAGIDGSVFENRGGGRSLIRRLIFFIGLHEAMLHWSRTIVKPVVDDTMFETAREERWLERLVLGSSFGCLCWWRLRDEVESLVAVVETKLELAESGGGVVGFGDFVGWWLYYLTVTIGMARVIKTFLWITMIMFCRRLEESINDDDCFEDDGHGDHKV